MSSKILVLAADLALMPSAMAADSAAAGKPEVRLSYQLYSSEDGRFVADYIVQSKGGRSYVVE